MKWYLILMCFVLLWKSGFLVMAIVDMLSQNNVLGPSLLTFRLLKSILSCVASHPMPHILHHCNIFGFCWRWCNFSLLLWGL